PHATPPLPLHDPLPISYVARRPPVPLARQMQPRPAHAASLSRDGKKARGREGSEEGRQDSTSRPRSFHSEASRLRSRISRDRCRSEEHTSELQSLTNLV